MVKYEMENLLLAWYGGNYMGSYISGGLNPESDEADRYAKEKYESRRKQTTDCVKISNNTGLSLEIVSLIKGYIFHCRHILPDGYGYFSPSYEMAESWKRLSSSKESIQPHDITLLKHEATEIGFILQGFNQSVAHDKASKLYNYHGESNNFYKGKKFRQTRKTSRNKNW